MESRVKASESTNDTAGAVMAEGLRSMATGTTLQLVAMQATSMERWEMRLAIRVAASAPKSA